MSLAIYCHWTESSQLHVTPLPVKLPTSGAPVHALVHPREIEGERDEEREMDRERG